MPNCPRIMLTVPVLRRAKYEADPLFLAGEKDNWAVWQLALLLFYQSTKRLKENSRNDSINTCLWIMPFLSDLCPIIALRLKKRLDSLTRACTSSTFFHFLKRGTCFIYPCCVIESVKIIEGGTDYREFGCHMKRVFWGFPGILMQISHKYCLADSLWSRVPVYIIYNAQWGCSGWNFGH